MHVPEHINGTGEECLYDSAYARLARRHDILEKMEVPDRIKMAGGDVYDTSATYTDYNVRQKPIADVNYAVLNIPATLKLEDTIVDHRETSAEKNAVQTQSSVAVDENPLLELKRMRRQLIRVMHRLDLLEETMDRQGRKQNIWMTSTIVGSAIIIAFILAKR